MRIIGGTHRSRFITFPDAAGLRPTPDRVRETLFNWLGQTLHGKRCLDLFAGSGALGFEAASRGAAQVVMVEQNPVVFRALQDNARKLAFDAVALYCADGLKFSARTGLTFDVILLDPPFRSDHWSALLPQVGRLLAPDGVVYVESGQPLMVGEGWQVLKQGRAGAVHYQLLRRA
ncbi:MAG: 16S rRNA (guanine(966)-N(2))-methyltransferase RsmD [Sideroxydans sp.]